VDRCRPNQNVTAIDAKECAPSLRWGVNQRHTCAMEVGMLFRNFERLATAADVVTVVLMFAVPFVLALITPFLGR
jgi:hypothetical protein